MWKYSSCKCNVKWPPTKGMCSWRLGGELGAKKKAQAETDIGGMERTENIDGGFKCAFCCSCYVGDGRSCSTCGQAPVCGTGGLAVWLRLQYPVVRETKSCIFGWQQLMDCSCWDKHSIQQGLRNLNTCKKRGLPHNCWTQQELWSTAPSLSQEQDIADPCRDAVLQTWETGWDIWNQFAVWWFLQSYRCHFQWS